jgi:hypothetical protein
MDHESSAWEPLDVESLQLNWQHYWGRTPAGSIQHNESIIARQPRILSCRVETHAR